MIGGGDTGSDCIGTSIRQGALSVTQLEIMPPPPEQENKAPDLADWPLKLRTSSSQEEGAERDFAVLTQSSSRRRTARWQGAAIACASTARCKPSRRQPSSSSTADLVLLAMGFVRPRTRACWSSSASSSTRAATSRPTPTTTRPRVDKVFAAGDMRRGQSLVVWAIREGRQCARAVDEFLMGATNLPR